MIFNFKNLLKKICLHYYLAFLLLFGFADVVSAKVIMNVSLIEMADNLFENGSYDDAITEYKRFIFFHPGCDYVSHAYYKMGLSYQNMGQWQNSINSILRSIELCSSDSIKNKNRISFAVSCIAKKDYKLALFELKKVIFFSADKKLIQQAHFFTTVVHIYQESWEDARSSFQYFVKDTTTSINLLTFKIDTLLSKANTLQMKSLKKAKILSTILPGAGQLYAGKFKSSFNSTILNGINFGFMYHLLANSFYVDASLFFLYVGIRYYKGNIYHAIQETQMFNKNKIDTYKTNCINSFLKLSNQL